MNYIAVSSMRNGDVFCSIDEFAKALRPGNLFFVCFCKYFWRSDLLTKFRAYDKTKERKELTSNSKGRVTPCVSFLVIHIEK